MCSAVKLKCGILTIWPKLAGFRTCHSQDWSFSSSVVWRDVTWHCLRVTLTRWQLGPQMTVAWSEPAIFSKFGRHIFWTCRVEANVIVRHHEVPCRLSSDPKMIDVEWFWDEIHPKLFSSLVSLDFGASFSETTTWKRMKILRCCEWQKCSLETIFWWYKVYADIRYSCRWRRRQLVVHGAVKSDYTV